MDVEVDSRILVVLEGNHGAMMIAIPPFRLVLPPPLPIADMKPCPVLSECSRNRLCDLLNRCRIAFPIFMRRCSEFAPYSARQTKLTSLVLFLHHVLL